METTRKIWINFNHIQAGYRVINLGIMSAILLFHFPNNLKILVWSHIGYSILGLGYFAIFNLLERVLRMGRFGTLAKFSSLIFMFLGAVYCAFIYWKIERQEGFYEWYCRALFLIDAIVIFCGILLGLIIILSLLYYIATKPQNSLGFKSRENNRNDDARFSRLKHLFSLLDNILYQPSTHNHHEECPICLSRFTNNDEITVLPCDSRHYFHKHCLVEAFKHEEVQHCPICKSEVTSQLQFPLQLNEGEDLDVSVFQVV